MSNHACRLLLVVAGLVSLSCSGDPTLASSDDIDETTQAAEPACDPPSPVNYPIIIGQNVTGGWVTVSNSCTGLTFTAHLEDPSGTAPAGHDYVFDTIAIDVQTAVPPVRPPPGKFAYQYAFDPPSRTDFSQTLPYSLFGLPEDVCAAGRCDAPISILFHMAVTEKLPGGGELHQTGWSGDHKFKSGSWGYYLVFTPCCTCTVTPEPTLAAECDGSLHYEVVGATCQWTFSSEGRVIASSDTCSGDLTVSVPTGSTVDATVHVTSADGCTGDGATSATTRAVLDVTVDGSDLTCHGVGDTGSATANATGGTGSYTYLWSPGGQTTQTISGLAAGTYGVVVKDTAGCTSEANVTLAEPSPLELSVTSDDVVCHGGAGGATVTVAGGTAPYAYLWSNGAVTASISGVAAGEYSVTVTDGHGCSASASAKITEPPALTVEITSDNVECTGGASGNATAVPSGGTGPYAYLWSNGATGASLVNVKAGSYVVTVTDASGCPATASVSITEPPALTVEITSDNVECTGGASGNATAVPSGGTGPYTFSWSNGATGASLAGVPAGEYSVTVTDASACPASASVTITEPTALAVQINSDNVECFGGATGNATAVPTGGAAPYTFLWSNGATGDSLVGVPAGDYSVTVTDAGNCPASASVTITEPPLLAVEITSDDVECYGGASGNALATPSGGTGPYTFLWSNGATGASLSGVPAGEYSVTVTDASGCPASTHVSISEPPALAVEITSDNVECSGGTTGNATAVPRGGTGPYTFSWSNGFTGASLVGVAAGEYNVTVTDASGCPASASVSISEPPVLAVEITSDNVECSGGATGNALAIPSGGTGPYTFLWSNGATSSGLSGVPAGDYGVTVTDASGCPASAHVTITEPAALAVEITSDNVECSGGATGNALATPSGGTGPYTFLWSNGATGASLSGVAAGDYSVTVTDASGCPASASVSITQPPALAVEITSDNVECFGGSTGNATAVPSGGTGPYTFAWSNGATGASLSGVAAGTYSVTLTDASGCPASAAVTISEPPALAVQLRSNDVKCFGGTTGNATAIAQGGTEPYAYAWSTDATTPGLADLAAGSYSLTVTDANGCSAGGAVIIGEPPALQGGITAYPTCGGLRYEGWMSGGTGTLTPAVTVTGPGGFSTASPALAGEVTAGVEGTYHAALDVTDANGCALAATDDVVVFDVLGVTVTAPGACEADLHFTFDSTVAGGSDALVYEWLLYGDGVVLSTIPELDPAVVVTGGIALVDSPGAYLAELKVTDTVTGCVVVKTGTANIYAPLSVTLAAATEAPACPMPTDEASFTASVSGGSGAYQVIWAGEKSGDTCLDDSLTCRIAGQGLCDSRSITATVRDLEAADCVDVTSAPGIYEKKTTVSATTF